MVDINTTTSVGSLWTPEARLPAAEAARKPAEASFGNFLQQAIQQVDGMQQEADQAAGRLVTGENKDIHGTMIAIQKADIAMNLMIEVRNKVISAYDEIKRMQF